VALVRHLTRADPLPSCRKARHWSSERKPLDNANPLRHGVLINAGKPFGSSKRDQCFTTRYPHCAMRYPLISKRDCRFPLDNSFGAAVVELHTWQQLLALALWPKVLLGEQSETGERLIVVLH